MWRRKTFEWFVDKPLDINQYIGRAVRVKDDDGKYKVVEIERLLGSKAYPYKYQVDNGDKSYLISMLDFYAQMNGEKISEEEIKAFDETLFEIQETPKKVNGLWRLPN